MKIAFLNSCLEPGRDGVGDYTRLLAEECRCQGHECYTIGIHDQYVSEPQSDSATHLRLPAILPWAERIKIAQQKLTDFAPDWISLQFVPYAFHPKGLVHGLGHHLLPLFGGKNVHIMFHELWIGAHIGASRKHKVVGTIQKTLIFGLLQQLKPNLIHTSNHTYLSRLAQQGQDSLLLPLFGNIPISEEDGTQWLLAELTKSGRGQQTSFRSNFWFGGFFGHLFPFWPPEPLLTLLCELAAHRNKQLVIWSIGRLGTGNQLWNEISNKYASHIDFIHLGEQTADKISQYLSAMDFGIATSPWSLIGKSGAVAAMLDHGLPVVVNRDDEHFRLPFESDLNHEPLLYRIDDLIAGGENVLQRMPIRSRLPEITSQFIKDLQTASGNNK